MFSISGWLQFLKPRHLRTSRTSRKARRRSQGLAIERLEARLLLSADFAADQLLVQFQPNATAANRAKALAAISGNIQDHIQTTPMRAVGRTGLELVQLASGWDVLKAVQKLQKNPFVALAEPNWVVQPQSVSNDPYYTSGSLWGMQGDASSPANQYGSQAAEAWATGATGSSSVFVGIIDEGIDYTHPDLAANIWTNPYDPVDGIDNDGNGYTDDIHGWDFVHRDNTIYDAADGDEHGTHVAGTIGAAGGNGLGVAGMVWNVEMISTKFMGPNGGYVSDAVKALDYLTDLKIRHGINIVASNNSWGGGGYSQALADAIARSARADILFIAAAGNGGSDGVGDNNDLTANYPSNYSTTATAGYDSVVAVAAISNSGSLASWSNYGATTVDLGAPGVGIWSTLPGGRYGAYSGTSMATPHVTGAVALYAATHPGASGLQIKNSILNAARNTPTASLNGKTSTAGRLNVSGFGDVVPALEINNASIVEGNSGLTTATFTVTLTAASTQTITVSFSTANGSAVSGSDYAASSGTLIFAPGVVSQTIAISILGDTFSEANENFFVNLTGAVNAAINNAQGVGTILNDDVALPTVSIGSVAAREGNSGFTAFYFTVTLSAISNQTVSVGFTTVDGTARAGFDYIGQIGTVTFNPGETTRTVAVQVLGDIITENNETFFVRLLNPQNAGLGTSTGQGIIQNDDRKLRILGRRALNLDLVMMNLDLGSDNVYTSGSTAAKGGRRNR